jgi:hypothetical protein
MIENMSGLSQGLLFALGAYTIIAILADCWTTSLGLAGGLKEMNPINKFLFAKIGQALTTFIEGAAVLFTGVLMSQLSPKAAFVYLGAIATEESVMAVRNYFKLKAAKIKFSLPF